MTDRIIWLDYAAAVERVGPRPRTDYHGPVACPECGYRRECSRRRRCLCGEPLMGPAALRWRAEVWKAQGYPNMHTWLLEVAETVDSSAAAKAQREVPNEELDRLLFGAPLDEVTR